MPFKERTRQFWMDVAGGKCQEEIYDETRGFYQCDHPAEHVHHIIPEAELLAQGEDPEHAVGMPVCKHHHENFDEGTLEPEEFSPNFSHHPDMGWALREYRNYKERVLIHKMKGLKPPPSDFEEVHKLHKHYSEQGIRYVAGTPEIDQYYLQKMTDKATRYIAETGKKKPITKPHPETDPSKRKRWYGVIYQSEDDGDGD